MTAATLDGPPPAVAGVFMGADYNTTFGTMSWVLPQPRAAPYFVAPVCVPDGTDPIANLAPGFATDPVCTSPDCWVIGGPCPPNTINRCFSYSQSTMNGGVWGLAKVNASSYSTAGSAPMQIFAPVIGPEEQGFKACPLTCFVLSISQDASSPGVTASSVATLPDFSLPQRAQVPSVTCGRASINDLQTTTASTDVFFTMNWVRATTCGWNEGTPTGLVAPRAVQGTLGINANRNSPEMGTTCPAASPTTTSCQYHWKCPNTGIPYYWCWWTVTSNYWGSAFSTAGCAFPFNPNLVIMCPMDIG